MGEIAALTTALCWAIAARLFRILGGHFSAVALNFWKGLIALVMLAAITQGLLPSTSLSNSAIFWLLVSGVIGIGFGDTCFFKALNTIGDSQSILVAETLAPIFTALLAMAWIGEWLNWQQWCGVAMVLLSVDMVLKVQKRQSTAVFEFSGYAYAAGAALCQAVGAVLSRDILTSTDIDAFNASQIRLFGGMAVLLVFMIAGKHRWLPTTSTPERTWLLFFWATLIGTFAALYLQMVAFTHSKAGVVQTLFATSVVLSLVVATVLGEKIRKATVIWSVLALCGVTVLVVSEQL